MVTCYEQRMCQLESGAVLCIGWNEDVVTGQRLENHYTVSYDGGRAWSDPQTTGILGQASSVCSVGGEFFLALHAVRRDTECPGIYGCVVDFSKKRWDIVEKQLLWKPETPVRKDSKMAEIFSYLKFGQPGAVRLNNGKILMTHGHLYHVKSGIGFAVRNAIDRGMDVLLFGHTHEPLVDRQGALWIMNPGSIRGWGTTTYGVMELEQGKTDCRIVRVL